MADFNELYDIIDYYKENFNDPNIAVATSKMISIAYSANNISEFKMTCNLIKMKLKSCKENIRYGNKEKAMEDLNESKKYCKTLRKLVDNIRPEDIHLIKNLLTPLYTISIGILGAFIGTGVGLIANGVYNKKHPNTYKDTKIIGTGMVSGATLGLGSGFAIGKSKFDLKRDIAKLEKNIAKLEKAIDKL